MSLMPDSKDWVALFIAVFALASAILRQIKQARQFYQAARRMMDGDGASTLLQGRCVAYSEALVAAEAYFVQYKS